MFARMTTFEGRSPDAIDDGIRNVREYIIPAFRELVGFRGIVMLVDRSTAKWVATTFWASEEALRTSEELAGRLREQALSGGERMTSVERFEVAVVDIEAGTAIAPE